MSQFAIKDAAACTFYNRKDGKPVMYSDYLNSFSISLSEETVYAMARGSKKIAFANPKEGTVALSCEVFEPKYLSVILSADMVEGATNKAMRKVVTLGDDLTVAAKEIDGAIVDTISVFKVEDDKRTHIEEVSFTESAGALTLTGVSANDTVVVYYMIEMLDSKKIVVTSKSKNTNYTIEGVTTMTDEFGQEELLGIRINNCRPQGNVEINLTSDAVVSLESTWDMMPDENGNMLELVLLGEEADATFFDGLKKGKAKK